MESWLIDYGYLHTWEDVRRLLYDTEYPPEDEKAQKKRIWRAAIDTGGGFDRERNRSKTDEIYRWIYAHRDGRIFGIKGGSHRQQSPVRMVTIQRFPSNANPIPGGLPLYLLDTDYFKELFFSRMRPENSAQLRLHRDTDELWADQVTAEKQVQGKNGRTEWVKVRTDNHYLDCAVMASACVDLSWTPSLAQTLLATRKKEQPKTDRNDRDDRVMPERTMPSFMRERRAY